MENKSVSNIYCHKILQTFSMVVLLSSNDEKVDMSSKMSDNCMNNSVFKQYHNLIHVIALWLLLWVSR